MSPKAWIAVGIPQQSGGPDGEITLDGAEHLSVSPLKAKRDLTRLIGDGDRIGKADGQEDCGQLVITVVAQVANAQGEIDLGGSFDDHLVHHH